MEPLGGWVIGELVCIIAMGAMFAEKSSDSNLVRAVVLLHGLLVLAGVDLLLHGGMGLGPWDAVFRVANMGEFCLLGVGVVLVSEETLKGALSDLFMPFLLCGAVTGASLLGGGDVDAALWWRALSYLGLYYYVVAGGFILALLLSPPAHAPAAKLTLAQRFSSGFGLFFITLQLIWWAQLFLVMSLRGDAIFSGGAIHVAVGVAALLYGAVRAIRRGLASVT